MSRAEKFYDENIKKYNDEIKSLDKLIGQIAWGRLIVLVLGLALSYKVYKDNGLFIGGISLTITLLIFLVIALLHGKIINKKENTENLLEFNEKGMKRLNGEYRKEEDKGEDLLEEGHSFAADLDIFGQNSLFQMINSTRTSAGRKRLGEHLALNNMPTREEIKIKQEAIKELGEKVKWREKLYVNSTFKKKKNENLDDLIKWGKEKSQGNEKVKICVASIFIAITLCMLFMVITKMIPLSFLILDFMVNFAVVKLLTRDIKEVILLFNSMKNSVKAYTNILTLIEEEEFKSEYLNELKSRLNENNATSCSNEMKKLSNLLGWVGDSWGNAYFFLLNIIFFADVFILLNLNKWREINGNKIENWLDVMVEVEAISSISNLAFDHDDWCYSEITEKQQVVGNEIAHPLIGERAVANDYKLEKPKQITLITGSNMSGKSTFLRTVGINLILSYIGAPSCAKSFKCSIMNVYTCMRTKDNLEESISSFYAEILRIKLLIEASRKGEKLFFLLDEIFKGTNSKDRHTGATVLVKQLAESGAMGLLSTHDLELCDLEGEMKEVENYNFREFYKDNKICFDYKLRRGKSTTQNAVYLMKLAGIDIK